MQLAIFYLKNHQILNWKQECLTVTDFFYLKVIPFANLDTVY